MKDPAILFYPDKWITATQGMDPYAKAWYLELILYQYDNGSIPNDFEKMASICRIYPKDFILFKHTFKHQLKQKFKQNQAKQLYNEFANEILVGRKKFKSVKSKAGKLGYIIKYAINKYNVDEDQIEYLKANLNIDEIDTKNIPLLEDLLEAKLKLYINVNVNVNKKKKKNTKIRTKAVFRKPTLKQVEDYIVEKALTVDAKEFFNSNNSKGWVVGKFQTPMKDWKSALNTWQTKINKEKSENGNQEEETQTKEDLIARSKKHSH